MTKKKKPTLGKALINLVLGIPVLLSLTKKIGTLVGYEARLAGRSILGMIMLILLSVILLSTTWLCLLAMLFVYLMSLHWSMQIILLTLVGVNVFILLIVFCLLIKHKKRLCFPETRYLLEETFRMYKDQE